MWCLSWPNGDRTFHPTKEQADTHPKATEGVVWFDSFDYDRYNQGKAA
jgi:hypothetical protein